MGPATGFTVAWLYWLTWTVALGSEFTAAGLLMQRWFPHTSVWMWSAVFALFIFLLNAFSVKFFAESEFWFSSIKVLAIVLFILLGGSAMFGIIPIKGGEAAPMLSNLTAEGGLFPNGFVPILMTMLSVNFAFSGTELIGIAAGESVDPDKTIPKAIKKRSGVSHSSLSEHFVLSGLIPIQDAGVIKSPFVAVFDRAGVPYAADIMNFVILTAIMSAANSGLYASSRMLWSLSKEKTLHPTFAKLTSKANPF
nr:amino acid permease [Bacillus subtilis]